MNRRWPQPTTSAIAVKSDSGTAVVLTTCELTVQEVEREMTDVVRASGAERYCDVLVHDGYAMAIRLISVDRVGCSSL
jgi:hypothetical protein